MALVFNPVSGAFDVVNDDINKIVADTGSFTSNASNKTLNIKGSSGVTTSISGNTLTVSATTQRTFGFFIS